MSLKSQRRLAAEILKVGEGRVWIDPDRTLDVEVAITRDEVRKLIHEDAIKPLPKKGISRSRAKILKDQKKKGLRKGPGGKSGSARSKISKKRAWMLKIRPLRNKLRDLKDSRVITKSVYRKLYNMAGSGVFESTADLERYIQTRGLERRR